MLTGLSIPLGVSWFTLSFAHGNKEKRLSPRMLFQLSRLARLGRARKIEAFFKPIKSTFALRKAAQGTRLGRVRFLLSRLAFVLAFASQIAPPPGEGLAWGEAAQQAALVFLPTLLVLALLAELERRRPLLEQLGWSIHSHRLRPSVYNCKI